jgi:hypothetical protein
MTTDTDRLNFILIQIGNGVNVNDLLGDYEGDDEEQYLASAREAIDTAIGDIVEKVAPHAVVYRRWEIGKDSD